MTDLSTEQTAWLGKHLSYASPSVKGGRPKASLEVVLKGVFWVLDHSATWHDLPDNFGTKSTVHRWFHHWAQEGSLHGILEKLGKRVAEEEGNALYEVLIHESGFKKAEKVKLFIMVDEQGLPVFAAKVGQEVTLRRKKLSDELMALVACLEKMDASGVDLSEEVSRLSQTIQKSGVQLVPLRVAYKQRMTKFGEVRALKRVSRNLSADRVLSWLRQYRSLCSRWDMSAIRLKS